MKKGLDKTVKDPSGKKAEPQIDEPPWSPSDISKSPPNKLSEPPREAPLKEPPINEPPWRPKDTPKSPPRKAPELKPGEPEPNLPVDE